MSTVARTAGLNLNQVLGAIGATANAITTTVNAVGSAADTLATHTDAWATRSKRKVNLDTINYMQTLEKRSALDLARQLHEIQTELSKNEDLRTYFEQALALYNPAPAA